MFTNPSDGSEVKTTESAKSYKDSSGVSRLSLKHRRMMNCGREPKYANL
jgi:hypothetical protein